MTRTPQEAMSEAIELVGGSTAMAKAVGTTKQAVLQWKRCPKERVKAVVTALGKANRKFQTEAINLEDRFAAAPTAEELRPDIYGKK